MQCLFSNAVITKCAPIESHGTLLNVAVIISVLLQSKTLSQHLWQDAAAKPIQHPGQCNYLHLHLVQCDSNSYIHSGWWLPCKVPTSTSGAVWGSVSCPKTLVYADKGIWTSDLPITRFRLCPWAAHSYRTHRLTYQHTKLFQQFTHLVDTEGHQN